MSNTDAKDLIPFKFYRIEIFSDSGEIEFYQDGWFAKAEVSKQALGLLECAA